MSCFLEEGGGRNHWLPASSRLTVDQASLPRRDTVPSPVRDTSNIWALITFRLHIAQETFQGRRGEGERGAGGDNHLLLASVAFDH